MFVYLSNCGELYETALTPEAVSAIQNKRMFMDQAELLAVGYSGHGLGENKPALEAIVNVGPIPRGLYTIGCIECCPPQLTGPMGPFILPLTPNGHTAFNRHGFYCHGDNQLHNLSGSEGCVVMPRFVRIHMGESTSKDLLVRTFSAP